MSDELIDPLAIAKLNLEQVEASLPDYVRALRCEGWEVYDDILCLWAGIDELTAPSHFASLLSRLSSSHQTTPRVALDIPRGCSIFPRLNFDSGTN